MLHYVSTCLSTCLSICLKIYPSIVYRCRQASWQCIHSISSLVLYTYKHSCLCLIFAPKNHISGLQFWHFVSHKINKLIVLTGHQLDFPASHVSFTKREIQKKAGKKLSTSLVQCSFKIVFSFLDRPSQFPIPVPHLASRPHPPSVWWLALRRPRQEAAGSTSSPTSERSHQII